MNGLYMRKNIRWLWVLFVWMFTVSMTQASTGRAILIGIDAYGDSTAGPAALSGAVNDIELIDKVLQNRFGFEADNMVVLKNEAATHVAIEQAFMWLNRKVEPGDPVYVHYSGHGSFTRNFHPDEAEAYDQTWVPYGSRRAIDKNPKNNCDILDDEINEWLSFILEKTDQVVFVSDSCHSASVSRGEDAPAIRAAPVDDRVHPLARHAFKKTERLSEGIFIGASRDDESAGEFRAENGENHGLFTWFWAQAMQQAQPGDAWNDLFDRMKRRVINRRTTQNPQIKGPRNMPVFGGRFEPASPRLPVIEVSEDGETAVMEGGILGGVTRGSIFRVYDPGRGKNATSLATLEATHVSPFTSSASVDGVVRPGDLVVEESHVYEMAPIPVFLNADFPEGEDQPILRRLQAMFEQTSLRGFERVEEQGMSELVLYVIRPRKTGNDAWKRSPRSLPRSFPSRPPEVWVLTDTEQLLNDRLRIPFKDPEKGMNLLKTNLKKIARVREIKKLSSGKDLKMEFHTVVWAPVDHCRESRPDCLALPDGKTFFRRQGVYNPLEMADKTFSSDRLLTFVLRNKAPRTYYAYLIDITPTGAIQAIFPTVEDRQEEAAIGPMATRDYRDVAALATNEPGEETIKLIVTDRPINVALLESDGYERGAMQIQRDELNPLEKLLADAMEGTRGTPIRLRRERWGTMQYAFEVER